MKLSIIIPTHNRVKILKEGLDTLYKSINKFKSETIDVDCVINVVVIDDGSKDGTGIMINDFYPEVAILEGDGNFWWTKAINCGAKYSIDELKSDFILLWNDDILPEVNYISNLIETLKSAPKNIIIGSKILDNTTRELWSSIMIFNKFSGSTSFSKKGYVNKNTHYKWLTGMGVVVSDQVVKQLNYWDDVNFPQYFGDMDFTLRASKANIEIIINDDLVIFNRTEYSSFKGGDIKTFIASLKSSNIGSRYNMLIRYKMLKMHTTSKLWMFTYLMFYVKYAIKTFVLKK